MSNKITVIIFAVLMLGLSAFAVLKPRTEYSESERRKLAAFPKFTLSSFESGSFAKNFETASLDQFPLRDKFRTVKALAQYKLFGFSDNNGIYITNGYAAKQLYPLNEASVKNAAGKINSICENFLNSSNKVVVAALPDKGFYLAENSGHLALDYEKLNEILRQNAPVGDYVDLTDTLSADCYYKTDTHWRQDKIAPAAEKIAAALGAELENDYTTSTATDKFYGVYYGQSALPLPAEEINYVTSSAIDAAKVYNAETKTTGGIYDFDKLSGKDPYEFFLSGSVSLLKITNPTQQNGKRLVVFRDSFGSALVPYLVGAYSEITVVDTRYMNPSLLSEYVDFEGCDVLFLYSTLLLNDSYTLK